MKFTPNYEIEHDTLIKKGWEVENETWLSKRIYDGFRFNYTIYYSAPNGDCYAIAHKSHDTEEEMTEVIERFEWLKNNRDGNNVEELKILLLEIGDIDNV